MENFNAVYIALIAGPITIWLSYYLNRRGKNLDQQAEEQRQLYLTIERKEKEVEEQRRIKHNSINSVQGKLINLQQENANLKAEIRFLKMELLSKKRK